MNKSDSERISAVLELAGFTASVNEKDADLVVVNACSVRQPAVDRVLGRKKIWRKMREKNPHFRVVVTGCVLPADKASLKRNKIVDLVFNIKELGELPEMLKSVQSAAPEGSARRAYERSSVQVNKCHETGLQYNILSRSDLFEDLRSDILGEIGCDYLEIKPAYSSKFSAFVPIMTGCNNYCSYCAVPYTRGAEVSRPFDEVIAEVRSLVKKGYKEIYLLGQNVNSYKTTDTTNLRTNTTDITDTTDFVSLCRKIDEISGEFWVRFMSSNPYDFPDELIEFLAGSKHFCKGLHLAMQSGDDEVLQKMNRRYNSEMFLNLAAKIRKAIPDVTLSTDVIVGFCGESNDAFLQTVEAVKKSRFSQIFIGQYSTRPGTVAAKMFKDNVAKSIKVERDKKINVVLHKIAKKENERFIGRTMKVLVEGQKVGKLFGRNEQGIGIVFEGPERLVGEFVSVEVKKAGAFGLEGLLK